MAPHFGHLISKVCLHVYARMVLATFLGDRDDIILQAVAQSKSFLSTPYGRPLRKLTVAFRF
jgi:hypothetical protein